MHLAPSTDPVVIIGAGPVGLLLACELGVRDVPVIVLEAQGEHLRHPKANTMSSRAMEIYRKQGLSHRLRDCGGLPADRPTDVGYFTRLFGRELYRVPMPSMNEAMETSRAGDAHWPTPEPQFRTTQMTVEPILLERARSCPGVDVRFGCRAAGLEQDAAGVTLLVEGAGSLRASYVAGCDGGKSFVRKSLGLSFEGEGGLNMDFLGGRMLATYFRAPDLLARFPHPDTWMHWIMQPEGRAVLLAIDPRRHEFLLHFQLRADERIADIDFAARLAAIVGETLPHEVLSMAEWRAGMGLVAQHYGSGRCFLAGDAAHLFTPTGGFGLNTGIEDAFNLGWKLAAVHKGQASTRLLDSYEIERRPIGVRNTGYALKLAQNNGSCPVSAWLDDDGPQGDAARAATTAHLSQFARREFDTPGVQLGARYDQSPVIIADGTAAPADLPADYVPSGSPGGRLPHIWIEDGTSLFDILGPGFTLLCLGARTGSDAWPVAAARLGIDLTVARIAANAVHVGPLGADALLVRPDQHIAWRGMAQEADPVAILQVCLGHRLQ